MPLITKGSEYFVTKEDARCAIRKYEVLDEAGQTIPSSSELHSLLYISELSDQSKLVVNLNTDLGEQEAKAYSFSLNATANRTPFKSQKVKLMIGCFDQSELKVEF